MATVTRKRPRATPVNQDMIGQASALLQELPEKQKEDMSLREAIGQMQESLRAALAKGYSYADLAAMLSEKGIKISPLTLKNYVPSGKRQAAKTPVKRAKKSVREGSLSVESASGAATPPQQSSDLAASDATGTSASTPVKRGRAKSSDTAKSSAAKTNLDSKTSSAGKASTRAPSTRGRKKLDASK